MHGDGVGPPILLKLNAKKELQFVEVIHLKFAFEASLDLIKLGILFLGANFARINFSKMPLLKVIKTVTITIFSS